MNHDETNLSEKNPEMQTWIEPELEARIVAWVAGEASAFEVAELERLVAEKPELAIFKRRIEAVHGLVGEAARKDREPLRMAEERRAKLLETLRAADKKTETGTTPVVIPLPARKLPRWKRDWWIVGSSVAAACLVLFLSVAPWGAYSRKPARPDPVATHIGTDKAATPLELVAGEKIMLAQQVVDNDIRSAEDVNTYIKILESEKLKQKVSASLARDLEAAKARMEVAQAKGTKVSEQDLTLVRLAVSSVQDAPASSQRITVPLAAPAAPQSPMPEVVAGAAVSVLPTVPAPALAPPAELMKKPFGDKAVAFDTNAFGTGANSLATTGANNIRLSGPGVQGGITYTDNSSFKSTSSGALTFSSSGGNVSAAGAIDGNRAVDFKESSASVPANQFSFNNSVQRGGGGAAGTVIFGAGAVTLGGAVADMELKPRQAAPSIGGTVSGGAAGQALTPEAQALARADAPVVLESFAVTAERSGGYAASSARTATAAQVNQADHASKSAIDNADDRDVGYLAKTTTSFTRGIGQATADAPTVTTAASNEVVQLSAFTVESTNSAKRRPAPSTAKAPSPPTPTVARARTAPNRPAAVATRPTPADTLPGAAPAPTPVVALSSPPVAFDAVSSPATSPATPPPSGSTTAALGLISLDSRKDVVNDELKAANLEQVRARLQVEAKENAEKAKAEAKAKQLEDAPLAKPAPPPAPPIEETSAAKEPMSTFSLHVSDVSFRLAAAALARGEVPDAARIRAEEFYNAFDYGDPAPTPAEKVSCRIEQSAHPFAQQRNLVRIAMKVGATGRGAGTPLRLTVLLDTSGSMEREDRHTTVQRAMEVLVSLLGPNDRITLVGFARTPRLLAENLAGNQAASLLEIIARTPPDGGTNLEEALKLAGELARRHRDPAAQNRIVMLTDGAANLGNAVPAQLATAITTLRQQGIAFDACGVGLDGLDDDILESLTRSGDGRYYALNSPADADAGFAQKLAGAFRPAAENVKLQVRFNAARVGAYRLIGFEQHRLRAEDFRNDKVDAAELAAEEAAVALYQVEALPSGDGDLGEVFVRFRDPATGNMIERSWPMTYDARAAAFDRASPTMQLAGTAALLAETLRGGAPASAVRLAELAPVVNSLRTRYANVPRVQELATMYAQMRRVTRE